MFINLSGLSNKYVAALMIFSMLLSVGCLEQKPPDDLSSVLPSDGGSPPGGGSGGGGSAPAVCDSTAGSLADVAVYTAVSQEIVPLCDGDFVLQDRALNKIGLLNIGTLAVKNEWQLTATPSHMIVDSQRKYLYVAGEGLSKIARIDLTASTSNIDYINTTSPVSWLTFGEDGFLFANLTSLSGYNGSVDLIDINSMSLIKNISGSYPKMMIYNKSRHEMIMATTGLSPASLYRYSFDTSAQTLTQVEYVFDNGSNANYLAISPDETRFAFPVGSGNTSGYSLFDYSTSSIAATNGTYNVGAYPVGAAFSPDSRYFLTTNGDSGVIKVYDTTTHAIVKQASLDVSMCSYARMRRVAFSSGGGTVYVYLTCGFSTDSGLLYVLKF